MLVAMAMVYVIKSRDAGEDDDVTGHSHRNMSCNSV